jgi:hypothetical protein
VNLSVICPVLNECPWIGYGILAALPYVEQFVYALDEKSDDGTRELLHYVKEKYAKERLIILEHPTFHPHDMKAYNGAFNRCIQESTGDACIFLHPDMIIVEGKALEKGPLAWFTQMTSYAGDLKTVITKGRADKWKNIHAKKFGLTYFGGYGSQNEDFYHTDITGKSYRHYGLEFSRYPYHVADSGIRINHYCELKSYKRRLEKMKLCLKTLAPESSEEWIEESAINHPRVTLEPSSSRFGEFLFEERPDAIPDVFTKHKEEFEQFTKEAVWLCQK